MNNDMAPVELSELIPAESPGFWVMFFADSEFYNLEGIFSTLTNVKKALTKYYEPKGLSVSFNTWQEGVVEVRVTGLDPGDNKTELNMSFLIQYSRLDEFND